MRRLVAAPRRSHLCGGLLAFVFGAIALFLGAAPDAAAIAIGIAAARAVAAYLLSSLAELVGFLKPLRADLALLPLRRRTTPCTQDWPSSTSAFLLLLGAAAVVAALVAFERRDLATPMNRNRGEPNAYRHPQATTSD